MNDKKNFGGFALIAGVIILLITIPLSQVTPSGLAVFLVLISITLIFTGIVLALVGESESSSESEINSGSKIIDESEELSEEPTSINDIVTNTQSISQQVTDDYAKLKAQEIVKARGNYSRSSQDYYKEDYRVYPDNKAKYANRSSAMYKVIYWFQLLWTSALIVGISYFIYNVFESQGKQPDILLFIAITGLIIIVNWVMIFFSFSILLTYFEMAQNIGRIEQKLSRFEQEL
jgi:ABC-type multidrug transport system fused ATPase/permease subunit